MIHEEFLKCDIGQGVPTCVHGHACMVCQSEDPLSDYDWYENLDNVLLVQFMSL